jgi:hypothetical protein
MYGASRYTNQVDANPLWVSVRDAIAFSAKLLVNYIALGDNVAELS